MVAYLLVGGRRTADATKRGEGEGVETPDGLGLVLWVFVVGTVQFGGGEGSSSDGVGGAEDAEADKDDCGGGKESGGEPFAATDVGRRSGRRRSMSALGETTGALAGVSPGAASGNAVLQEGERALGLALSEAESWASIAEAAFPVAVADAATATKNAVAAEVPLLTAQSVVVGRAVAAMQTPIKDAAVATGDKLAELSAEAWRAVALVIEGNAVNALVEGAVRAEEEIATDAVALQSAAVVAARRFAADPFPVLSADAALEGYPPLSAVQAGSVDSGGGGRRLSGSVAAEAGPAGVAETAAVLPASVGAVSSGEQSILAPAAPPSSLRRDQNRQAPAAQHSPDRQHSTRTHPPLPPLSPLSHPTPSGRRGA